MENKKSYKANIEKNRGIYFQLGVIISLACILLAFEWGSSEIKMMNISIENQEPYIPDIFIYEPKSINPQMQKPTEPVYKFNPRKIEISLIEETNFPELKEKTSKNYIPIDYGTEKSEVLVFPVDCIKEPPLFLSEDYKKSFPEYIYNNIIYPERALEYRISGRVFVQFIVDENGDVVNVELIKGKHWLINEEALRVIKSCPKWTPGKYNNKPVKVKFTFPIVFECKNY